MVFGPMALFRTNGSSDQSVFGPMGLRTNGSSDQWAVGPSRRPHAYGCGRRYIYTYYVTWAGAVGVGPSQAPVPLRPVDNKQVFLPNGFKHCACLAPPCSVCDRANCDVTMHRARALKRRYKQLLSTCTFSV